MVLTILASIGILIVLFVLLFGTYIMYGLIKEFYKDNNKSAFLFSFIIFINCLIADVELLIYIGTTVIGWIA